MIKLLRFMKPYRAILVLVVVLAAAQALSNLYLPNLFADIVDNGIVKGDTGYIWQFGGLMLLVTLGGTVAAVVGIFFSSQVATGFGKIIRARLFTRMSQFSLHEFDTVSTSSLFTRTTNDTTQVQQVMILVLNMMITAPFTLIAGIILALNQDVGLTWILAVVIPILVGTIVILMSKAIPLFRIMQFFFSSRRRHTSLQGDWSSDVCSSDYHAPGRSLQPSDEPRDRAPRRPLRLRRLRQLPCAPVLVDRHPEALVGRAGHGAGPVLSPARHRGGRRRPRVRLRPRERSHPDLQPRRRVPLRVGRHAAPDPHRLRRAGPRVRVRALVAQGPDLAATRRDPGAQARTRQRLRQGRPSARALGHAGGDQAGQLRRAARPRRGQQGRGVRGGGHVDLRGQPRPRARGLPHVPEIHRARVTRALVRVPVALLAGAVLTGAA